MPLFPSTLRKRLIAFSLMGCLILPAGSALAIGGVGDIVYDPTNYVQAVKQVQAWAQQYRQMAQSISKAEATLSEVKTQVAAVTGVRGFGDLLNSRLFQAVVPADLGHDLARLNETGLLSGKALSLREASALYNCGDVADAAARKACQALLGQTAQAQALQNDTLALLDARTTQIEGLRAAISQTGDPKAIAELQARLAAEQAQVTNDQSKIVLAQAMLTASYDAAVQVQTERVQALMATDKPSVLDGFSFSGLGYAAATPAQLAEH